MSSDQPAVNSETIEQTKQQIRGLVSEIAQLSKSDLSPQEYYAAFMQRIVSALAAMGGAVWTATEDQQLEVTYQINLDPTLIDPEAEEASRHLQLLNHVISSGEPQLIPPQSGEGEQDGAGNPTHFLLVLAPLWSDRKVEGIIEIFQRPDAQPATQRGYLRFLLQMCELAGEWMKSQKLKQFSDRHSLWAQADQFARLVHEDLDVRETAYTISNEGRRLVGCDRVSVAVSRRGRSRIEAVSGQDTIENRSNTIYLLEQLVTRVIATGEGLYYDGSTEDMPPQLEEAIDEYVDESYSKMIIVLPLRKPLKLDRFEAGSVEQEAAIEGGRTGDVIGALVVEQIETDLPRDLIDPRIDLVYEHSARAISNSLTHNNVFMMPVWRTIGNSSWLVRARMLPKTLLVTGIILLVLLVLFFYPAQLKMEANGALQPVNRRDIFVKANGYVDEQGALINDRDQVKGGATGDVLVRLTDPDLVIEEQRVLGLLQETRKGLANARRAQFKTNRNTAEGIQLDGQVAQLEARKESMERELNLLKEKRKDLEVRSPIDGQVVIPWDVKRTLANRPVAVGQVLMTVIQPNGRWELELMMPERRIGHVNTAQQEIRKDLVVSFVLATDPGKTYEGTVKWIDRTPRVEGDEGTVVRVLVDIDEQAIHDLRPGASVTADIHCGRSSLGYVWFHEVFQWVQLHLFF